VALPPHPPVPNTNKPLSPVTAPLTALKVKALPVATNRNFEGDLIIFVKSFTAVITSRLHDLQV
jgi:hypothetical protein